jgi:bifunctional DNA-binding transcriptional regulator/antitoxin component of YhaV-PrlF toxin-antitoxin module
MSYVVGPKGQIVVAKEIRDRLGVEPGWIALQRLSGDHLEVYFVPPEHRRSLKGSLAEHLKARVTPDSWSDARKEAWEKAAQERTGPPET